MPKKSPKKTPARVANKAAGKAARLRTPSRKKSEAAAAVADDGEDESATAVARDVETGDDSKCEVMTGEETVVTDEEDGGDSEVKAGDTTKEAKSDVKRVAKGSTKKATTDDDGQAAVAQMAAMLARLPPAMLSAAFKAQAAAGSVAGSDFSDVSESDGEDTRSVLPPRAVEDVGPSKRLRGGKDRLPGRQSGIRRTHAADMTEEEMDRVERTLTTGAKVPSFSRARARGHRFGRPSSLVMDVLVDEGELPPAGDADRTMASMFETFRAKSAKDARKEVKKYATFGAWFERYSEMGFLSKERLQEDPDTYWCFD
jgi:hypothetical protein